MGDDMTAAYIRYHECGHALADWLNGDMVFSVTVAGAWSADPEKTPYFCLSSATASMMAAMAAPALNRQLAWRYLSGMAGERIFGYAGKESGRLDLKKLQEDIFDRPLDPDTVDMNIFRLSHLDATAADFAEQFLPKLIQEFSTPQKRSCLVAGAEALEKETTLDGRSLVKIFEKAHGRPLPPGVLPAGRHQGPPIPKTVDDYKLATLKALEALDTALDGWRFAARCEDPVCERLVTEMMRLKLYVADHL